MSNNCKNCTHWQTIYGADYGEGRCDRILDKIEADVNYGWDGGYVDGIDTAEDFSCILHSKNTYTLRTRKVRRNV